MLFLKNLEVLKVLVYIKYSLTHFHSTLTGSLRCLRRDAEKVRQ